MHFQAMHHFSQKIVAIQNALVFICLHWNNAKKQRKGQIYITPENGLDRTTDTLNLIFGSTPFGKITEINHFLTMKIVYYPSVIWTTPLLPNATGL